MTPGRHQFLHLLFACFFCLQCFVSFSQNDSIQLKKGDTSPPRTLEDYVRERKGFVAKMMKSVMRDTTEPTSPNDLQRNEVPYAKYEGYKIRHIIVNELPFGIPINDSAKKIVTTLTKLANALHSVTNTSVIRKNLFFKKYDSIQPYLLADNVRFLRQLPFMQDVSLRVIPASFYNDSADILIVTKDVFSIGGSIGSLGVPQSDVEVREDNLGGSGNAIIFQGLLDTEREKNFGYGLGYIYRNIGGSFMNAEFGFQNFFNAIDGPKQESRYLVNFNRPLETRYMRWTYQFSGSWHATDNMYNNDSVYLDNFRYRYYNLDAWAGYNLNAKNFRPDLEDNTLRKIAGLRIIDRKFSYVPEKYQREYYWRFANMTGILGSMTFYRQNFYKTKYIFGFGRNEDIPEGLNLTLTAGIIKKENLTRPFLGFNYERSYFNDQNNYLSYKIRAEGNLNKTSVEDINLLAGISYVRHLNDLGKGWSQRYFFNLDAAQQVNSVLNEPLYLNSKFGLPELGNNRIGGTLRAILKAESVFFSPWSLAAFRFAPFIFVNTGVFSPYTAKTEMYHSFGGGLRTRNESLIFGTFELKAFYFPNKNFRNQNFRFDISTNVRFKYNPQLIRRPDFIEIN
ncbi:hypothetical protein BH20BAC1_BH20BAC1_20480 [soil metagenome]